MKYLDSSDVILINSKLIGLIYPDNMHQEDRVKSAVAQIKQNVFGQELYEGLFLKQQLYVSYFQKDMDL